MAANQNVVQLIIEGNNVTAIKAIDGTETKLKELGNRSNSLSGKMGDMFGSMGSKIALGATAAVAGFSYMIKEAINLGDELNDMSKRTGVSVESLSTLKYAAEISGTSFDGLGTALKFLNKNIYEASLGNKELTNAFSALGAPAKDAAGNIISADQALYKIADKFKTMPDGVEKTALAMKVFGRSGSEIIPMLNDGSEGLIKMQQEAEKLGLQMSTKTAQEMDAFNDQLARIEGSAQGAAVSLVSAFGPAAVVLLDNFANGLDIIFGKIELINGTQFKEIKMSIEQTNEYTKALVGTTKEWRQEQIKVLEQQIAIASVAALSAEAELARFDNLAYGAGILAKLFTDEDNQLENRIRTNKTIANGLLQQLELLKKFGLVNNDNNNGDKDKSDVIKKRAEEIARLNKSIQFKIDIIGISDTELQLANLRKEIEELRGKGVSESLLSTYMSKSENSIYSQIMKSAEEEMYAEDEKENQKMQQMLDIELAYMLDASLEKRELWLKDHEYKQTLMEKEAEMITQIYTESFESMASVFDTFYQISGQKSRALFDMYKSFAIANAMISAKESVVHSYNEGTKWGGPILGAAFAVTAAIAQAANVAQIMSLQPGTKGGGSYGAASNAITPARNYNNSTTNNSTTNNNRDVTLIINGDIIDPDQWFRKNRASIRKLFEDGVLEGA